MARTTFLICEGIFLLSLLLVGLFFLFRTAPQSRKLTLVFYLQSLALFLLFIVFSLAQGWASLLLQPSTAILVLTSPLLLGILTLLFTGIFRNLPAASVQGVFALLLLCLVILGFLAALLFQPYALFFSLLPGALTLSLVWLLIRDSFVKEILLSLLFVIFMGLVRTGQLEPLLQQLPAWLGLVLRPVLFLQAGLVVAWSAWLAFRGVETLASAERPKVEIQPRLQRYTACLRLGAAIFLLTSLFYTVFWASLWDHTDNGLGGVWMAITGGLLAIAAGGLIMERRRGWLRTLGLIYLLPVTALLFAAFFSGIRYPYHPISDRRAAILQEAIGQFYAINGRYPVSLAELVPGQLLWVPRQVVLRNEAWCYQGGANYYRLGDFWRQSFGSLIEIKTYASAGNPPEAGWTCQEDFVKMQFRYDPAPLIGGGQ